MYKKNKQIKKIAFLTSSLATGGAQENIINLSKYFVKKNYQVDIISLLAINDYEIKNSKFLHFMSLIDYRSSNSVFNIIFIPFIISIKLLRLLGRKKYDLLIGSHEYYPFYLATFFAKIFRTKNILLVGHNIQEDLRHKNIVFSWLHKSLIKLSFMCTDKIICVSKSLAAAIKKDSPLFHTKIEIIYNGIDGERIKILSRQKASLKNWKKKHIIATLGRFVERKGFDRLINVFNYLKKGYPELKLLIIGKGQREESLRKQVRNFSLENDVIFLKFTKKGNPYKYLSICSLFVFSSLYEGFGNVIIEAMVCGIPVISTNAPYGPSEILDDSLYNKQLKRIVFGKYGILVPKEELLGKGIIKMLMDTRNLEHYKKMGLQRAEYFNVKKMCQLYEKVIQDLVHI